MEFDHKNLPELFDNVTAGKAWLDSHFKYIVKGPTGDIAELTYMGNKEWHFYIDNFPGPKKYYNTNMPIASVDEFISELKRIGLILVPKSTT